MDGDAMWIHSLRIAKRVVLIVVGFTLLVAGIVMSVPLVPGPGLLVVVAALAILAVEFVWARRWLARVKTESSRLRDRLKLRRNEHASETK
jgi:tellurite resistance protein TerC